MFKLEHSQTKNGGWVLTDTENLIVIEFIEHKFRESHKVTFIDEAAIIEKYNPEQTERTDQTVELQRGAGKQGGRIIFR